MHTLESVKKDSDDLSLPELAHVAPDRPADPSLDGDYEDSTLPVGPVLTKALYTLGGVAVVAGTFVMLAGLSGV